MKISDIASISVSKHGEYAVQYALSWVTADARYHIWLYHGTHQPQDDTIYKNPPIETVFKGPGYFRTRHLKISDKINQPIVAFVLAEAAQLDLFALADREGQLEKEKEAALNRERARVGRMKEAGPALYAALKALIDHDYIYTTGNHDHLRIAALVAVAEAEKE